MADPSAPGLPKAARKRKAKEPIDTRTPKQKKLDLKLTAIKVPHVPQPALFDRLPLEIRRMIIPHLEDDPYALLALQVTCKSWYLTLCTGKNVDVEWQNRCAALASPNELQAARHSANHGYGTCKRGASNVFKMIATFAP